MVDEIAAAIADPVRRAIMEMLREAPLPAGKIAERFEISRPAVSRHLRVLRESGLVSDQLVGRQRIYGLHAERLTELAEWIARCARPSGWEGYLDAMETEVYRTRREHRGRRVADQATDQAHSDPGKEHTA